jgi:hypothetical protein
VAGWRVRACISGSLNSLTFFRRAPVNKVALHHYINFFDFSGLRLDLAFRCASPHTGSRQADTHLDVCAPNFTSRPKRSRSTGFSRNSVAGTGSAILEDCMEVLVSISCFSC